MEKETAPTQDQSVPPEQPQEAPPPFNPDPRLVTFLERGANPDPQKWFRETDRAVLST